MYDEGSYEQQQVPQGYVPVSRKDNSFLQWFLQIQSGLLELKLLWRGWERNSQNEWVSTKDSDNYRVMNERGIHWCVSIMQSYLNKISQSTNWDNEHMSYEMRKAYRIVWNGLIINRKDFGLSKMDTAVVARQVLYQIHSMLLAARGEGIRKFIQTTQSVSEHRVVNENPQNSLFSGVKSLFGGRNNV